MEHLAPSCNPGLKCTNAVLCLCPAWSKPWVQQLVGMASKKFYYEQGVRVFEKDGKPCPNTLWGMWALRIDKGPRLEASRAEIFKFQVVPRWRPTKDVGTQPQKVDLVEEHACTLREVEGSERPKEAIRR